MLEDNTYNELEKKKTSTFELVPWFASDIVHGIKKCITLKESIRHPWKINFHFKIKPDIFTTIYKAIEGYHAKVGRLISVKRKRLGHGCVPLMEITITFNLIGVFCFHLNKLTANKYNLKELFTKVLKYGNNGKLVYTNEKPIILKYRYSNETLSVNASYEVVNRYGFVV